MGHRRERCPLGCMEAIQIDPVLRFFGSERCETMRSIGGGEITQTKEQKGTRRERKKRPLFSERRQDANEGPTRNMIEEIRTERIND